MGLDNGYGLGIGSLKPGVCTSSTRPASAYDGQMIYETDTNLVRIWNGSAWKTLSYSDYTSGSVLQTVHYNISSNVNYTTTAVTSGITATITPSSTASKILVTGCTYNISHAAARDWTEMKLYKNGSSLVTLDGYIGDQSTTATAMSMAGAPFNYLDSPATTSATTYAIFLKTVLGNTWTVSGGAITLQEIAG
jgi:hypothetical protein